MSAIATPEHKEAAAKMRALMSLYRENKDLIDVGMYVQGTNPKLDVAIQMMPQINAFLQQKTSDTVSMDTTVQTLVDMMRDVEI
jgi:flagellum-specific ATP synthase